MIAPLVVTFDLFSALLDSRAGGAAVLGQLAAERGWPVAGERLYDLWDIRNKQEQAACATWVPYRDLAVRALASAYDAAGGVHDADPVADLEVVLDSLPEWPLWPDVAQALPGLADHARVGLLSNVDDELFRRTAAAALVDPALALTSERLRAYKPHPAIYRAARQAAEAQVRDESGERARVVHVATSGRDVRGALEAGLPVVRLRRPGHRLDPQGPRPSLEAAGLQDLLPLLARAVQG